MTKKKEKLGVAILTTGSSSGSAGTKVCRAQEIMEKMDAPLISFPDVDFQWFCKNAKLFNKVDWKRSYELSEMNDCKIKECYYNAWKCDISGNYDYYEGVSRDPNLPVLIGHSWLVNRTTGEVIDPTFAIHKQDRKDLEWIGVKIDRQWLNKTCIKFKRTGDFIQQWSERNG